MIHKFSSPRHPSSNAVAESGVRNAKRLVQKTDNEEEFQNALSRFRSCPRSDGPSPAFLFYHREARDPNIPSLPEKELRLPEGARKRLLKRAERSEKTESRRELSKLSPGTLVLLQDPTSRLWTETGRILSIHDEFERSYLVKRHGRKKPIRRNRIYLRPLNEVVISDDEAEAGQMKKEDLTSKTTHCKKMQQHQAEPRRSERIKAKQRGANC